jgi:hypothetical protein
MFLLLSMPTVKMDSSERSTSQEPLRHSPRETTAMPYSNSLHTTRHPATTSFGMNSAPHLRTLSVESTLRANLSSTARLEILKLSSTSLILRHLELNSSLEMTMKPLSSSRSLVPYQDLL